MGSALKRFFTNIILLAKRETDSYWKYILFIYLIEFFLAWIISYGAVRWIDRSMGDRGAMNLLLQEWDQQVVSDLLNTHGSGFWVWLSWSGVTVFILVLFRFAWNAGLFYQFWQNSTRFRDFRHGIFCHFGSVIIVVIPYVLLGSIWIASFVFLITYQFRNTIFENEHVFWQVNLLLFFFGLLGARWFRSAALFAQHSMIGNTSKNLKAKFHSAIKVPLSKVTTVWFLDICCLVFVGISFYLIAKAELVTGVNTVAKVSLYFMVYQALHIVGRYLMVWMRRIVHLTATDVKLHRKG